MCVVYDDFFLRMRAKNVEKFNSKKKLMKEG